MVFICSTFFYVHILYFNWYSRLKLLHTEIFYYYTAMKYNTCIYHFFVSYQRRKVQKIYSKLVLMLKSSGKPSMHSIAKGLEVYPQTWWPTFCDLWDSRLIRKFSMNLSKKLTQTVIIILLYSVHASPSVFFENLIKM